MTQEHRYAVTYREPGHRRRRGDDRALVREGLEQLDPGAGALS